MENYFKIILKKQRIIFLYISVFFDKNMPELPEVQTIVSDLSKNILDKKIINLKIILAKITKNNIKILKNKKFTKIIRRGKYIFIKIENDDYLAIHLRMTGQLIYKKNHTVIAGGHSENKNNFILPSKHTHVVISFEDKSTLYYNDQRQFGYLEIINDKQLKEYFLKLGIEPLSKKFDLDFFSNLMENKKQNIKAFLLNQKYIAGIGNIYADEILFKSKVKPTRNIKSLQKKEIKNLFHAIKSILKKAIEKRGTTFNNYVDAKGNKGEFLNFLKVYNREGEKCSRCENIIIKNKIASRGTNYCNVCQK